MTRQLPVLAFVLGAGCGVGELGVVNAGAGPTAPSDDSGNADARSPEDRDASRRLQISTLALPDGRVQIAYETTLAASRAGAPPTFSLAAGDLPPGLTLAGDGTLAGVPTHSGDYAFSVSADDGDAAATASLAIHVPPVVLMSGYGPFMGYPVNPSIEALRPLDEQLVGGLDIRVVELTVAWDVAWTELEAKIEELSPAVIIGTGVASDNAMRYETTARNSEFGVDVDDINRVGDPVVQGGPATLSTELPIAAMSDAVKSSGYPTVISGDAGAYLCNFIFYEIVHFTSGDDSVMGGFIHVPSAITDSQIAAITAAHRVQLEALAVAMQLGPVASPPPMPQTLAPPVYIGQPR